MNIQDRIKILREKWFLTEPAYFIIFCTHNIEITSGIKCSIACGNGNIYINDKFFDDKTDRYLEESLKMELMRILLKHPYQRQLPNRIKMYLSSNFVLANNMKFYEVSLKTTFNFFNNHLYDRESLEGIYDALNIPDDKENNNLNKSNSSSNNNKNSKNDKNSSPKNGLDKLKNFDDGCLSSQDAINKTQFWKEDEFKNVEINNIISKIDKTDSWGTIPGEVVTVIKKSIEPKFNYKALFQQFRSTILSSKRTLTRMKPNRRFGYDAMGSKRDFTTKILVAIDTSGSISDDDLALALGFINKFFKYGIEEINSIQFDTKIYEESLSKLTKKLPEYKVVGRGGTDFNCVFEYVQNEHPDYNGVIILTDGYAYVPDDKWKQNNYKHTKYLWCLNDKENWERFRKKDAFLKFGKCTYVDKNDNQ